MEAMGVLGILPTVAGFAGAISGGTLSDVLLRRGFSKRFARAQAPAVCTLIGVPMILAAALVPWASVSVVCITLYMYLANPGAGACWAVPLELDSKQTGTISGVMNGAGNFAGIFGPMSAGFLVAATGDWSLPFLVIAGVLLLAALLFYFLVVPEPIELAEQVPELAEQAVQG